MIFAVSAFLIFGLAIIASYLFSKKFVNLEFGKLNKESDTFCDRIIILAFGSVISVSIISAAYFIFINFFQEFHATADAYFQLIIVFAVVLTAGYVLIAPRHPEMRFLKTSSDKEAEIIYNKLLRITTVCFFMSSAAVFDPTIGRFLSGLAVVYGFFEILISAKLITEAFAVTKPRASFLALKLLNFFNEKIAYLCLFGMCLAIQSNYAPQSLFFFESLEDIFCILAAIFCLQILISIIISNFISWAQAASFKLYARNLIDICNVVTITSYTVAICFAFKKAGFDLHQYIFRDEIIVVLGIIWADVIIYKGFKGFTAALMKDAGAKDTEELDYTMETDESDYTVKVQTFLPTASLVFYAILFTVSGLLILSNLNINVAPILAAFTVFGAAVGLAAQDLIRSFMYGIVFLLEKDLYAGEYVKINGTEGTIEKLSARALYLREINGALHTIPYNMVGSITSYSQNYLYHNGALPIGCEEDVSTISAILTEVVENMKNEDNFKDKIVGKVEIFGLCPFDITGLRLHWRIKTSSDFSGINVKYEIYQRLYAEYKNRGIRIPLADAVIGAVR
ncbi:MAG: mechanosensitive ion channel family protein [Holosporaceae bacterium]|nr:mechanosensitive ion channel family protein [Holosporaceae bacterium]